MMTTKDKSQDQAVKGKDSPKQKSSQSHGKSATTKAKPKKTGQKAEDSDRVKELQEELETQKNKYLRLSADFDNFRKRTLREKMEMSKLAGEEIFTRILPVLDDLERAMKSIEEATEIEALKEGIGLIYNKLKEYLKQQGVKEIEAIHEEFDTDLHEAVTKIPAENKKLKGKVVDVIEKGYFLNDKVIRFSKVVIGE
jgi:molecular chaperone GrpE